MTVAVLLFIAAAPAAANATGTLHVTGTVTDQSGAGVQNVSVTATALGGTAVLFGPVSTASNGGYQLDVDPGTYDIHFVPPSGSGLRIRI
ncbi:MAG TPA: carboxypeptidase-like regulatory domain-containing protein [Micromonosporaceae bacterium]|nr:carboxypeptidase-like regulatory domain-containing protein [Micromonosporaceae bacterium]